MPQADWKGTVQEFADKLGVDKEPAYELMRFLVATKTAELVGVRPSPNGKGKGSNVYQVDAVRWNEMSRSVWKNLFA